MDGFIMEIPIFLMDDLGGKTPPFSENPHVLDMFTPYGRWLPIY